MTRGGTIDFWRHDPGGSKCSSTTSWNGFGEVEMFRYYKDANAKMLGVQYDVARRRRVICRAGSWH